jgi:hypothetical protein
MMFLAKKIRSASRNITVVEGPSLHISVEEFVEFRDSLQQDSSRSKSTVHTELINH